jgi:SAM-dependent methyltransferase
VRHAASAITAPDADHLSGYWLFHAAVSQAQLAAWLTPGRQLLVDVSGPRAAGAELAAQAGHTVLRIFDGAAPEPDSRPGQNGRRGRPSGPGQRARPGRPGRIFRLVADPARLAFLADGCADGVIADDRALSTHLAAEAMMAEIARVLRPDGRVLACVDSLVLGMAVLADQHHWAQLADLPHAEVVLVPWPDGTITRCYGPDQARELFSGAGLAVNWIRSRTVLSQSMVTRVLRHDPASLPELVRAELAARPDESLGAQLLISARRPRKRRASGRWQASGADGRTWPGS